MSELVFVLPRPRGRFATLVSALGELWAGELPAIERVDAVFDATRNRVLISAHYDARALTEGVRTRIQIVARDAGVAVLDGAHLDEVDRRALVAEGEHRVEDQPALAIALWSLARQMGGEEVWSGEPEPAAPGAAPAAISPSEVADRGGAYSYRPSRPVGIVPPSETAPRATRGGLGPPREPAPPRPAHTTAGLRPPGPPPGSRATRRDIVAPRPIGSRATDQPGRSVEDGTLPKIDIGTASSSRSGFTTPPADDEPRAAGAPPEGVAAPRTRTPGSVEHIQAPRTRTPGSVENIQAPRTRTPGSVENVQAPRARTAQTVDDVAAARRAAAVSAELAPTVEVPARRGEPAPTLEDLQAPRTRTARPGDTEPPRSRTARTADLADSSAAARGGPAEERRSRTARTADLVDKVALARGTSELDGPTERRPPRGIAEARSAMPVPAVVAPGPIDAPRAPSSFDNPMDSGPVTYAEPIARTRSEMAMEALSIAPGAAPLPTRAGGLDDDATIDVRYLRSGRWAPARLRALSLKGAYLITAAFPRVGDHVHIALGLGDLGALVRGAVFHVTTAADIASTGTSGFAVRFELDDAARAQLSTLLHRARAAGVTITPPPPRGSVRLPVQWPVKLATQRGATKGDALDVSRGGMFVQAVRALDLDQPVSFSAVLDDGAAPVSGHARVVREVSEADAARRGLRPGFGLAIQEMGDTDLERWNLFLARVQRRGEHRILVGASPSRLAEVTAGLTGAGYAVVGGTDAGSLVQLSDAQSRPPDVAVIDSTLLEGSDPNWLETLFSARKVPCITLRGDARRARVVVDKLLAV